MRALVLILALLGGCRTTRTVDPRVARLEAVFDRLHHRGQFTGAIVVGDRDHVIWQRGYGEANVEHHVAFTPDTAGDAASIAKTFTAALVVALAAEGKLDLDAPVQRLLPELPYPTITLRHLLSHASGIPVLDYDDFDRLMPATELRTTERLLAIVGKQARPLLFEPGTQFRYSSFGYDLAALAAARATGMSFGALLEQRFWRPLGMRSAFLRPGRFAEFPGVRTLGYRDGKVFDVFDREAFHGGSNIYVSAADLHRWNVYWLAHPVAALLEPARIAGARSGISLGSWYQSNDRSAFWYPGHLQGFHSVVFRTSRYSIAYIANNTLDPWLHHAIVRAIVAILDGRPPPTLAPPAVVALASSDRSALAGRWILGDGEQLDIDPEGRTIARDGVRYLIVPGSDTSLYVPGLDYILGVAKDDRGAVVRLCVSTNLEQRWATRAGRE